MNLLMVRTGTLYGPEYATRLAVAVRKFMNVEEIRLFTDRPWEPCEGTRTIDISEFALPHWWGKMALFDPAIRGPGDALFLDLDTIVLGDLGPFEKIASDADFSTCASFTRQFGNKNWPCAYGSCVMTFREGWGKNIWTVFLRDRTELMKLESQQLALEKLYPDATLLQPLLPAGFFLNYRELRKYPEAPPHGAKLVIFGGQSKPHNVAQAWAQKAWRET